jgi:putative transposase
MEPLISGNYYHIYNHSIGNENLFKEDKNYQFFLQKLKKYLVPVAETFAYCIMPNHFHILTRNKDEDVIIQLFADTLGWKKVFQSGNLSDKEKYISNYTSKQLSNLFSSYAQAYNRMYNRRGSLFIKNFKRKKIHDKNYFIKVVNYIHFNPVIHGFVDKPSEWKYSSYNAIVSNKKTMVERGKVLEWFGGILNFMDCHLRPMEI